MKFAQLLHQRDALLRQARLANLAFAYAGLEAFVARAARARLQGTFTLRDGDPEEGLPWPTLEADTASPAVLAEHFLEDDIAELADILAYLNEGERPVARRFQWETLAQAVLPGLRRELEGAGVPPQQSLAPESPGASG